MNFMTEEEGDRVAAAYGANYDRLAQIKKRYDPDNLFHLNQNIKPSPRQVKVVSHTCIPVHSIMARTLFILDDATLKSLGSAIIAKMMDEVKSIFSFAPKFTVLMTTQDKIPEKIDFTDSIVKVVAADDDVTAMQNQAEQQELRSIEFAIKKNKLNIKMASFKRNSAKPERGGVGWQAKEVLAVGGQKVALVQTGGIASVETAATDTLTFLAPNKLDPEGSRAKARLQT